MVGYFGHVTLGYLEDRLAFGVADILVTAIKFGLAIIIIIILRSR